MLLTNLGVMAGVYVGKRLLDTHKSRKIAVNQTLAKTEKQPPEPDTDNLHHAKVSGASLVVVTAAYFLYPPLNLLGVGIISYNLVPPLQRAFRALPTDKKVNNDSYTSLVTVLLVGTGNYFAAALHNVIYHTSTHLVEKSRADSARLAADAYQQAPETVWITAGGTEQQIPLEQVQTGDGVIITTGGAIPVDGRIIEGAALIDQQALTGEANPLEKVEGDPVMAATIVLSGRIVIAAEHSGAETRIHKLNELLQQTRDYKSQLQLKGEAWANRAALPLLAASAAVSPLIGVSPALALLFSAPLNTVRSMLSVQTAAHLRGILQRGIFIKDGRVLEELPKIDTILFDKTGTLTQTHPQVVNIITCGGLDADTLLAFAAAAEQRQEHPVALAILDAANERGLELPEASHSHYDLGLGITVQINRHEIRVGSERFIRQALDNPPLPAPLRTALQAAQGHTFILLSVDGEIQGALELHPRLRPEVPALINTLRQRGFKQLAIVSGDQQTPTQRLADTLGLDAAYGGVLPQDKAALIRQLQQQGRRVCFVGDGLNDAIAMKQANVSVCLSSASAITSEVAQIVLLDDSLEPFGQLFDKAEHLRNSLGKSLYLWIGFGATNALAVPLLAFGPFQSSLLYGAAYATGLRLSDQQNVKNC
ncbi:heavy metal translocating P-type ATPase [Thiothrix nivea]|uniref:Heavy metal translocating P-type ATPase n=1 Tax=Thiothrix nivea (strain ATCC 35100 / DSM 5205 / JP2) TaxID=870187 RepID=A0A656HK05_THINJ|nr:heavy metal translocating P-type ATPase [Thiothrix nivea]EIJ36807.1 heavy metal translocating P-type ATPase [Thiothrix nivea DSM 5205]